MAFDFNGMKKKITHEQQADAALTMIGDSGKAMTFIAILWLDM